MGRMSVAIDAELLDDARKVLGTRTKRETIVVALREAARRGRLGRMLAHRGKVELGLTREDVLARREQR